jgi:hypothetical protein
MTNSRFLRGIAVFCQLLSVFPFIVATEGLGFGKYVVWHYIALYAVTAAFCALGTLCGAWIAGGTFSRKLKPWAVFASRAAVAVPTIVFIVVCAMLGLSTGLYFYALPAAIIAYFAGHHSVGLEYSDVFSRGWFALYFVAAVVASIMLWFTHDDGLMSAGAMQLCVVFGVMIVLAAVLANQTNIDICTRQRGAGKAMLPKGLRSYNAVMVAAVCIVAVGLFLFAKPLAELVGGCIVALLRFLLSLLQNRDYEVYTDYSSDADSDDITYEQNDNALFQLLVYALAAALIVLVVKFRRQIWEFIKELVAPLFKENEREADLPFADEVTDVYSRQQSERSRRRSERQLFGQFRRETDPERKFRLGYALFLARLSQSPFAQIPSDTTSVHGQKGELAFRRDDLRQMVGVYNRVRYGGEIPTEEELALQERIISELHRG